MRTFTATADALRQRRVMGWRALVAWVLYRDRFGASPVTTTLRLSDRAVNTVLGFDWSPHILSFGALTEALGTFRPTGGPAQLDLVVANARPIAGAVRLTDLLRWGAHTTGYDVPLGELTVRLLFDGATDGDEVPCVPLVVDDLVNVSDTQATLRCLGRERYMDIAIESGPPAYNTGTIPFWVAELNSVNDVQNDTTVPADVAVNCRSETAWLAGSHVSPVAERWIVIHRNPTNHPGSIMRLHLRTQSDGANVLGNDMGVYAITLPGGSLAALQALTWAGRPSLGSQIGSVITTPTGNPVTPGTDQDLNYDYVVGPTAEDFACAFVTPVWRADPNSNDVLIGLANDTPPELEVSFF